MDEDLERLRALSSKIADSIMDAFERRFPTITPENYPIMLNSLIIALVRLLQKSSENVQKRIISEIFSLLAVTFEMPYDYVEEELDE